ncbi:CpaF family protein [Ruegeria atlantica]|uniref:Putative conjugal transfer proteinc/MT3759 n=1 Tax=Ruegeria atlantica TaxID=81569 RepID=A0A0P1E374_9RHOB|nr:CpaF family protein [Ruegeria atlantica]CUH42755.1 Putative conjugal transfer proteinc/MT3759 [Ruegeria atlantica]
MFNEFRSRKAASTSNVLTLERPIETPVKTKVTPDPVDTDLQAHLELKSRLHSELLDRLNLSVIDKVERSELKRQIASLVTGLVEAENLHMRSEDFTSLVDELIHEVMGLGPLEPLLEDPTINDILVNSYDKVYVERFGLLEESTVRFRDERHLLRIIDKIVSNVGRRIDESQPWVDARLEDGSRVNAIIRPCSVDGPALSIRKFSRNPLTIDKLVHQDSLNNQAAKLLAALVEARLNILISGGTGTGKTTMLNAVSSFIDGKQRIVTIEDAAELQLQQSHVVRLETRPANAEGQGVITQRELVRNALRMRPDRIIVGEVRGSECFDMLQAMNTGHDGSMTTVHANSARDALSRVEQMVTMLGADLPVRTIRSQISSAIQIVLQLTRLSDGARRVVSISEVTGMEDDTITMQDIFVFKRRGKSESGEILGEFLPTGIRPKCFDQLVAAGVDVDTNMFIRGAVSS